MTASLRLQFDPNQDYQLDAIHSVVRLFDGRPRVDTRFALGDGIIANLPRFDDLAHDWLSDNLRAVQAAHAIPSSLAGLDVETGRMLEGVSNASWPYPSFTIEMETGTGKTYVYLRTIHELYHRYGFTKFIVVVPSIAIYEGLVKNFAITRDHFRTLYANQTVNLTAYDGAQLSRLRAWAASSFAEILVITLDAFNKATNNLYKPNEIVVQRGVFEQTHYTLSLQSATATRATLQLAIIGTDGQQGTRTRPAHVDDAPPHLFREDAFAASA